MKHATNDTLDALDGLLKEIRKHIELRERKRGIFYLKATAFLHFHEDPSGIFADVKVAGEYRRYRAGTPIDRKKLLDAIARSLKTA